MARASEGRSPESPLSTGRLFHEPSAQAQYRVETRKSLTAGEYLAEVLASTGRPSSTDHSL